ncbi:MAG: group II intron reverse transcriptase/maturase, partial [Acidiferrobacterales bacterium]
MGDVKGRKPLDEDSNRKAGVQPRGSGASADSPIARQVSERPMFDEHSMEVICANENLVRALARVRQNRGSPGVDGMTVDDLPAYLKDNWRWIRRRLLDGSYRPKPVKRVEIPKPGSQERRKLGIPCVLDRFIQQALLQVLQKPWDRTFSDHSYGFRPGRSAHQAIAKAQGYVQQGFGIVVDIDLERFFDRVCHDRLMSRLAARIEDKRVLKVIRAYLEAGIMEDGLVTVPMEGTPQGGPLSPFLSNVVLDDLDKELEARGLAFVRYADDSNVYVKSRRAGERVMRSLTRFIEVRLKLTVNVTKSAVARPQERKFLGFTLTGGKHPNRRKIAPASIKRFRAKARQLTRRNWGISMEERVQRLSLYLRGWQGYFGYCETPYVLRDLDSWLRRRLRSIQWKQWKTYGRRRTELLRCGVGAELALLTAWSAKGPWRMSHTPGVRIALSNQYFDRLGLPRLVN